MSSRKKRARGFTLVELMIAVAIVAVLASIAGPAFGAYIRQSRMSEATTNLGNLYRGSAAYFNREFSDGTLGSTSLSGCVVSESTYNDGEIAIQPPMPILPVKHDFDFGQLPVFKTLGFDPRPGYFHYGHSSTVSNADPSNPANCAATDVLHASLFFAAADFDGNGLIDGASVESGIFDGVMRRDMTFLINYDMSFPDIMATWPDYF